MGVPLSQMWTIATYMLRQRRQGKTKYPLVLMLEPLFRCNLKCNGCGKTQYPTHILERQLSLAQCLKALEECDAPVVSIPGGEPLLHPEMPQIVAALVARKKYVYLCTNGLLLKARIESYKPSKYFSFSVHIDGLKDEHEASIGIEGIYERVLEGIKLALAKGFRVTTNTTVYEGADPQRMRRFFDEMMQLGVEGMMLSPGYNYSTAPTKDIFLKRQETTELFRKLLYHPQRSWKFNQSPLFLEFLAGARNFECMPWGAPAYNIFGWQSPCYLLDDGFVETFQELLEKTAWDQYRHASGNPKCADCMIHSGHEPTAVHYTFNSWRGFMATVRAVLLGPKIPAPQPPAVKPAAVVAHE